MAARPLLLCVVWVAEICNLVSIHCIGFVVRVWAGAKLLPARGVGANWSRMTQDRAAAIAALQHGECDGLVPARVHG